jgi:hypothetical protein
VDLELDTTTISGAFAPLDRHNNFVFAAIIANTGLQLILDWAYRILVGMSPLWTRGVQKARAAIRSASI